MDFHESLKTSKNQVSKEFQDEWKKKAQLIDESLKSYFSNLEFPQGQGTSYLKSSIEYSLISSGKRFRPILCLIMSEALARSDKIEPIFPFACAVEMVHTYSLIHDDLPCMDNDDLRRGKPTNHKVFGESIALLAGDALLTEAFTLLSQPNSLDPKKSLQLIHLLSKAAGFQKMVGGQALDLEAQKEDLFDSYSDDLENSPSKKDQIMNVHKLKTGALIQACCEGPTLVFESSPTTLKLAGSFGEDLGLCFQLADDLLDSQKNHLEAGSLPSLIGLDETRQYLKKISLRAQTTLRALDIPQGPLHEIVNYNLARTL